MRYLEIKTLISEKEGWVDRDMIMLHACFQILTDFVEKENGLKHSNYETYKDTIDELKGLYDWWKLNCNTIGIDSAIADEKLKLLIKHRSFLWT